MIQAQYDVVNDRRGPGIMFMKKGILFTITLDFSFLCQLGISLINELPHMRGCSAGSGGRLRGLLS